MKNMGDAVFSKKVAGMRGIRTPTSRPCMMSLAMKTLLLVHFDPSSVTV